MLYVNADTNKIVFSGVGKTKQDLTYAIKNNIKSIKVESLSELKLISKIVNELDTSANIALRLNPEIKSKTVNLIVGNAITVIQLLKHT